MDPKVAGLIGIGAMGRMLSKRLGAAGLRVRAFDVSEAGRNAARESGAELAFSAADTARDATFIHIIVVDDGQVADSMAGPTGVLSKASEGAIVLLHSTVLPDTVKRMADLAADKGICFVEAPIVGVPAEIDAGEARFLVGGPKDSVARARDHLLCLGQSVDHFGDFGTASLVKLARAMLNATERAALNEVLRLLSAGGADLQHFLDFERGHFMERCIVRADKMFDISANQARMRPYTNLFRKDVFQAAGIARSYDLPVPIMYGTEEAAERLLQQWDSAATQRE